MLTHLLTARLKCVGLNGVVLVIYINNLRIAVDLYKMLTGFKRAVDEVASDLGVSSKTLKRKHFPALRRS